MGLLVESNGYKINLNAWELELQNDPHRDFLLQGIKHGFKIVDTEDPPKRAEMENYMSTKKHHHLVEEQIKTEIENGCYIITKEKPQLISALGAIPKADKGVRIIHDCSQPEGSSVNDYATDNETFKYQTLKSAIFSI